MTTSPSDLEPQPVVVDIDKPAGGKVPPATPQAAQDHTKKSPAASENIASALTKDSIGDIVTPQTKAPAPPIKEPAPFINDLSAGQPADDTAPDQPAEEAEDTVTIDNLFGDQPADDTPAIDNLFADQPADDTEDTITNDNPFGDQPADDTPAADDLFADQPAEEAEDTVTIDNLFGDQPADDTPAIDNLFADQPAEEAAADQPAEEADEAVTIDNLFDDQPAEEAEDTAAADDKSAQSDGAGLPDGYGAILGEPGGLASDKLRFWVDNTGRFACRGRMIRMLNRHVRILKETGNTTTVPFCRLSQADLRFVTRQASAAHEQSLTYTVGM